MQIDLDFEGYFAISASSGNAFPNSNTVNSFKLFNPKVVKTSHHFEDAHRQKADHEHYVEAIVERIGDLFHTGADKMGESFESLSRDELLESIAL